MKLEIIQTIGIFLSLAILSGCDQHSSSERDAQTRIENRNEGLSRRHVREKIARDLAAGEKQTRSFLNRQRHSHADDWKLKSEANFDWDKPTGVFDTSLATGFTSHS